MLKSLFVCEEIQEVNDYLFYVDQGTEKIVL